MRRFNRLCCLIGLVTGSLNLFGQQGTSTMVGAVSDPADASIPNAALQLVEQATGAVRTLVTPPTGLFRFIDLPPGKYSLRVEAAGFKIHELSGIELASSETRDLGRIDVARLSADGKALTGTTEAVIFDGTGKLLQTLPGATFSMIRLSYEIPGDFYDFQKLP